MTTRKKKIEDGIELEIGESIRDLALRQMSETLLAMGVPQDKIDAAVAESKRVNNDRPMMALMPRRFSR